MYVLELLTCLFVLPLVSLVTAAQTRNGVADIVEEEQLAVRDASPIARWNGASSSETPRRAKRWSVVDRIRRKKSTMDKSKLEEVDEILQKAHLEAAAIKAEAEREAAALLEQAHAARLQNMMMMGDDQCQSWLFSMVKLDRDTYSNDGWLEMDRYLRNGWKPYRVQANKVASNGHSLVIVLRSCEDPTNRMVEQTA
jgi:hypothetical protein